MKQLRKVLSAVLLLSSLVLLFSTSAAAESLPYTNYTYDENGNTLDAPAAYIPAKFVDGKVIGLEDTDPEDDIDDSVLLEPTDLCYTKDGRLYVLDSGHGRIVELDKDFKLVKASSDLVYQGEEGEESITIVGAGGMAVDLDGIIYVADTNGQRIVKLDSDFNVVEIFTPDTSAPLLDTGDPENPFVFKPTKLAVDKTKKMYVVCTGVNQGLMEFDSEGNFTGYIGAPKVTYNFIDYIWRLFSTEEQIARMQKFVPTEFSNVIVDDSGFLYGCVSTIDPVLQQSAFYSGAYTQQNPVKWMNATGKDITVRTGVVPPYGDLVYNNFGGTYQGASVIVDVAVDESGNYSMLDNLRGRIFTYDAEGNFLYVFGGIGNQLGTFTTPSAIERIGTDLIVLDKRSGGITIFTRTVYADAMISAIDLFNKGEYQASVDKWEEVLQMNSNYQPAYVGIGKNYLRNNDYEQAIHYLRMADEHTYQSKAYSYYRDQVMYDNILWIALILVGLVAAGVVLSVVHKKRLAAAGGEIEKYRPTFWGNLRYSLYIMVHPFKGYWDLKHERKKTLAPALVLVALLIISFITNSLYRGEFTNPANPNTYNVFTDIVAAVLPIALWCVSSWCFTSLMDGKGTFKDIVTATCYAVIPMVLVYIPATIISNFMILDEIAFYTFFMTAATVWMVALIVSGTMITNDYSFGKTILTCILAVIGMGILVFIGLVFYSIIQQVVGFVLAIYSEITFRL